MSDTATIDTATGGDCVPVAEVPYNGKDEDCDGVDLVDVDGDGWAGARAGGADCDDADADVSPDAAEVCGNLRDDDCEGTTDAGCAITSAGPTDPGGLAWICGLTGPGPAGPALVLAFGFVLLRRIRRGYT